VTEAIASAVAEMTAFRAILKPDAMWCRASSGACYRSLLSKFRPDRRGPLGDEGEGVVAADSVART